ncbi:MAG: Cys-tRNA(Pro) deacylase [Lachnospiraceae bacterium]
MLNDKTNVMRMLDKAKIPYTPNYYSHEDGAIDGISVAHKLNQPLSQVYKTLVTQGSSKNYYVFVIPVADELHLKKAAKSVHEKSIAMVKVADIMKITGYVRGGCSPIGMRKKYTTTYHLAIQNCKIVMVSGGKIGTQIMLNPKDLIDFTLGNVSDII